MKLLDDLINKLVSSSLRHIQFIDRALFLGSSISESWGSTATCSQHCTNHQPVNVLLVFNSIMFYLWNTGLVTGLGFPPPVPPHPLKSNWRFFAKLVLFRKQSLNLTLYSFVPTFMHLAPLPVLYVCLCAKSWQLRTFTKFTLHPLPTPQNNEFVPYVLKQVVNQSCLQ